MQQPRRFLRLFFLAALALAASLGVALALIDPYGLSPLRLPAKRPMMDSNQRYMYPQLARDPGFDSAVFGTSTVRLLEPGDLARAFGGRFANLAMNAGTPWETAQMAALFLRHHREPRTILIGIDRTWCEKDADARKTTFRGFPESFYDDNSTNDLQQYFSLRTLEIGARLVMHWLGFAPPRIRGDGYDNFLLDESAYVPERARQLIWRDVPRPVVPVVPPVTVPPSDVERLVFPALGWLDSVLAQAPANTRKLLLLPPIHVAAQPRPGGPEAAEEAVCHARLAAIARARGAMLLSMQFDSPLTREDTNYWDHLHYRVGFAPRIVEAIREGASGTIAGGPIWRRID